MRVKEKYARLGVFVLGAIVGLEIMRFVPPPPVFSERLGRITHLQSYENDYFASPDAFVAQARRAVVAGRTPVIVLGDSTFRGTGAQGADVWTTRLQQSLAAIDPRLEVINFSQNGGDLVAPFMFYFLFTRIPQALFVVEWHYTNVHMERHPFHRWLTSEIMLRDGRANPAMIFSLDRSGQVFDFDEKMSIVMAALNIAAPYRDFGNYLRYLLFGNLAISSLHNPYLVPLKDVEDNEIEATKFVPSPDTKFNAVMREIYHNNMEELRKFAEQPQAAVADFFNAYYGPAYRGRLLLVTVDMNPYFQSEDDPALGARANSWRLLRAHMAEVLGLNWTSLIAEPGSLVADDFVDLGHLTAHGQALLAETVTSALAAMPAVKAVVAADGAKSAR